MNKAPPRTVGALPGGGFQTALVEPGQLRVSIGSGGHDLPRDLITACQLQPVLLETQKILANIGASRAPCLAGAMRGMLYAVFNFLRKKRLHLHASLLQFDPQARHHGASQSLRVAFARDPAEFEDAASDHLTDLIRIPRAMEHGEHRIKGIAQEFGTDIVENGAGWHGATRAWVIVILLEKSVGKSCDSERKIFDPHPLRIVQSTPNRGTYVGARNLRHPTLVNRRQSSC
jgi:hypothetical protein